MELRLPEILVVPLFQEFAFELLIRFSLLMFQLLSRLYSLFFQLCFLKNNKLLAQRGKGRGGGEKADRFLFFLRLFRILLGVHHLNLSCLLLRVLHHSNGQLLVGFGMHRGWAHEQFVLQFAMALYQPSLSDMAKVRKKKK